MEKSLLSIFFCLVFGALSAQQSVSHSVTVTIPKVALLDIESPDAEEIGFVLEKPDEAGYSFDLSTPRKTGFWLNYSSVKGQGQSDRSIIATLSGTLPEGFRLYLEAAAYSGTGKGKVGSATGRKELTSQPIEIVDNIGSCYTGNGMNNGHELTYSLEFDESRMGELRQGDYRQISVTYTFREN